MHSNKNYAHSVQKGAVANLRTPNGRNAGSGIKFDDYRDGNSNDINNSISGANRGENAVVGGAYHKWLRYGNVRFENDGKYDELCGPVRIIQPARKKASK